MRKRSSGARGLVVLSVVIGTLMPSETRAQEALKAVTPKGDASVAEGEETDPTVGPEAERFELSFGIAPTLGGLSGLAGLQGLGGLGAGLVPVAMDVAIPLGSRALLSVGGGGSYSEGGDVFAFGLQVPISVLCYLDRPQASTFVPMLRVQLRGSFAEMGSDLGTSHMLALGAGARGGLTYLFDDTIAIRAELGAGIDAAFAPGSTSVTLDLESALTLVLRT